MTFACHHLSRSWFEFSPIKSTFCGFKQRLLKAEKISKDDFLFKEYFKGVEVLGVRADERLLEIKNEKRLYKDVLAERGIKIAKPNAHSFSHKNHDLSSERDGGR